MMHKCYSVSRSSIDENNESVSKRRNVLRHEIVTKLTSVTEFSAAEDLASQLLASHWFLSYTLARAFPNLGMKAVV